MNHRRRRWLRNDLRSRNLRSRHDRRRCDDWRRLGFLLRRRWWRFLLGWRWLVLDVHHLEVLGSLLDHVKGEARDEGISDDRVEEHHQRYRERLARRHRWLISVSH